VRSSHFTEIKHTVRVQKVQLLGVEHGVRRRFGGLAQAFEIQDDIDLDQLCARLRDMSVAERQSSIHTSSCSGKMPTLPKAPAAIVKHYVCNTVSAEL
jgi:hypothetical protein